MPVSKRLRKALKENLETSLGGKSTQDINEINVNETLVNDPKIMASTFNRFVTKVGQNISDLVIPVEIYP